MYSRQEVIKQILASDEIKILISEVSNSSGQPLPKIDKSAKKIVEGLVADYNPKYIKIAYYMLSWLWHNIYDGLYVDKENLAKIKELVKDNTIILVPSHKSHIDYLILSYVFHTNELEIPFIAAGNNLRFWPLGHVFRKLGAFFIRREIKGDFLYAKILAKYMEVLVAGSRPIEVFIEGTRSRSGKLKYPKIGLLSMLAEASFKNKKDIYFVPISIDYERIMEEHAFEKELSGADKDKENLKSLIRSRKLLKKKYGKVFIQFGKPISLWEFCNKPKEGEGNIELDNQNLFELGINILDNINKVTTVTPSALVAAVLLANRKRGMTKEEVKNRAHFLRSLLNQYDIRYSHTIFNFLKACEDSLRLWVATGYITEYKNEGYSVYNVRDLKRLNLDYHKNNVIHFFVRVSALASSILSLKAHEINIAEVEKAYCFLCSVLNSEFVGLKNDISFKQSLEVMQRLDLIRIDNERISVNESEIQNLELLRYMVLNFIEGYYVVAKSIRNEKELSSNDKKNGRVLIDRGRVDYYLGNVFGLEVLSKHLIESAVSFYHKEISLSGLPPVDMLKKYSDSLRHFIF